MSPIDTDRDILDSLYRISSLVSKTEDPHEALSAILEEVIAVLDATSASIALINPESGRLEIEVYKGLPHTSKKLELRLGQGVTGWVALQGKPLLVGDVRNDARYFPVVDTIRSEMAVPMEEQGSIIGVVNVDSTDISKWDENDLKVLTLLTHEASRVVSRLWIIRQLKLKAQQLESLAGMSQKLVSKIELNDLLENIAAEALKIMKCKVCTIFFLNPDKETLRLKAIAGASVDKSTEYQLKLEESAVGTALHRKKQIEVLDIRKTEEHHFTFTAQSEGLISMLATPIIFDNEVIGVLNAYTSQLHRFNNEEKKIFATLASHSAVAINNARLYQRVFEGEEMVRKNEKLTTLGLLAAEIAHEIRNPLTVIKLLFESLELEFDEQDMRHKDVEIISEKLNQLEAIVSRVLSFGKSQEDLHSRWILSYLIRDTLHLVRLKLYQNKISIDYDPQNQPLIIEGSKGQLQQVFLNLIINATQAMPDGGKITIHSYEEIRDNVPFAAIELEDSGSGIPDDIRGRIFESFLSGHSEGSGLGLAIVKRIVQSHRGDIEVKESSSNGTIIKFWLPIAKGK